MCVSSLSAPNEGAASTASSHLKDSNKPDNFLSSSGTRVKLQTGVLHTHFGRRTERIFLRRFDCVLILGFPDLMCILQAL